MLDPVAALADRTFVLLLAGNPLARLRSRGSGEMFWETFVVEPLAPGDELAPEVLDTELWKHCSFTLQHERTKCALEVFSAGGAPPRRYPPAGQLMVELRGSYTFVPPANVPVPWWRRVLAAIGLAG